MRIEFLKCCPTGSVFIFRTSRSPLAYLCMAAQDPKWTGLDAHDTEWRSSWRQQAAAPANKQSHVSYTALAEPPDENEASINSLAPFDSSHVNDLTLLLPAFLLLLLPLLSKVPIT